MILQELEAVQTQPLALPPHVAEGSNVPKGIGEGGFHSSAVICA